MLQHRIAPALAALSVSTGALAIAADNSTEDLRAQIEALQRKIEALEARQSSTASVDALSQRVLDDAQRRSQFLQTEGFTAGYNKGKFTLQSADGNFSLSPSALVQFRYNGTYREDAGDGDSSYDDGFELRRVKIGIGGNVLSRDVTYKLQWASNRSGGDLTLEEAWVRYRLNDRWSIFGGQFEDYTSHESLVSSARQLAVEQSYANQVLIDSITAYTQGIGATYSTDRVRLTGAFTDGVGSDNTNYRDQSLGLVPAPGADSTFAVVHWGVSTRGEILLLGNDWKAYDDFSARGNKEDLLVLGGSLHRSEGDGGSLYLYSVDLQWEPQAVKGLSVFGAFLGNYFDLNEEPSLSNIGWVVQAGYLLNDKWEVFARYDQVNWDEDAFAAAGSDSVQEYTVGVNYFISGHNAKLTADLVYLPDGAPRGESGLGIIGQGNDEPQFVGRVQFQLTL